MHVSTIPRLTPAQHDPGRYQEDRDASGGRVYTFAILAAALCLRLLVLWVVVTQYPPGWLYSRGLEMGRLAQSLVDGRGLSSPFVGSTGPTAFFAPAYPIFIAAVFRVFGTYSSASAVFIISAQILLNLLTVWLIMRVSRQIFDARTANLAGAFWACSLPLIWLPTVFWETSLSTCVIIGLLPLVLRCTRRPTPLLWTGIGAYCGLVALINPSLLPASVAIFVWTIWQTRKISDFAPVLGLLAALIVITPWPIRNARDFHAFVPARSNMGFEFWMGNHPGSTGFLQESVFPTFSQSELDDYRTRGEIAYNKNKSDLAIQYVQTHPLQFFRLTALRLWRFWSGTGTKGGSLFYPLHALATTILGFIGLWQICKRRGISLTLLFLLPLLLFPIPYYITHAEFRFRIVIDPLLTILAAYSLSQLMQSFTVLRSGCVKLDRQHVPA